MVCECISLVLFSCLPWRIHRIAQLWNVAWTTSRKRWRASRVDGKSFGLCSWSSTQGMAWSMTMGITRNDTVAESLSLFFLLAHLSRYFKPYSLVERTNVAQEIGFVCQQPACQSQIQTKCSDGGGNKNWKFMTEKWQQGNQYILLEVLWNNLIIKRRPS